MLGKMKQNHTNNGPLLQTCCSHYKGPVCLCLVQGIEPGTLWSSTELYSQALFCTRFSQLDLVLLGAGRELTMLLRPLNVSFLASAFFLKSIPPLQYLGES